MNRREMLKYTALITGGALSASFTSVFLSGCTRSTAVTSELHFFDSDQFELVSLIADTILPRTDSPSATDVNVHHTIDTMIGLIFDPEFKTLFIEQWEELEDILTYQDFLQLDQTDRVELLRGIELGSGPCTESAKRAYMELKQQSIAYYLTTEEIGKNHLNYLPIPVEYKPSITIEEVNNRAWTI